MRILIFSIIFVLSLFGYFENLYRSQDMAILNSDKLPQEFALYFDQEFKEIFLSPERGIALHAVHFKAKNPKGVILYFHGRGGNIQTVWGHFAKEFTEHGYDVIMPDYRGFGKSNGRLTEELLYQDGQLFYTYASSLYGEEKTLVYGRSFGTGVATHIASKNSPSRLILESPYTSLTDAAAALKPYLPKWLIEYTLKYQMNNLKKIAEVKAPITLFHATQDETIPYAHSIKLAQIASQHNPSVECVLLDKATHNSVCYHPVYRQKIDQLLP